jgi:hypothetical protein
MHNYVLMRTCTCVYYLHCRIEASCEKH